MKHSKDLSAHSGFKSNGRANDKYDQALKQVEHLKIQGAKALKDLKSGFNKIIHDVKVTANKVKSDLS